MRNRVAVRPARLEDAERIAVLTNQLGYAGNAQTIRQRLASTLPNAEHAVFVAEDEHLMVVGWIHGYLVQLIESPFRVEIGGLVVDQGNRRKGIGRALVSAVQEWGRQRGAAELSVRCNTTREDAHGFYQTIGFSRMKTQVVFRKAV